MFALRASCSSTLLAARRCPTFAPRFLQTTAVARAAAHEDLTTPASFLEETTFDQAVKPTQFELEDDGPPRGDGYGAPSPPLGRLGLVSKTFPLYRLHCHASRNNTIVTFTEPAGNTIAWYSGGSTKSKFKKGNRASYEAGYQCAVGIFQKIKETRNKVGDFRVELLFKGFGEGREAMKAALLAVEGNDIRHLVYQVVDRTPIKIGGTRSKKARRG
ncbi:hypothetical protein D9613_005556 [Agrocybe pediades]|uniref:Translational machinery component n=1 Tax=Agrocybe pediades TaxID=84607 RepID=A0A8H4QZW1_9AGAR|nr:hypothetical protein D9613_005556 [Agrocybe pediades]KAF9563714.1 translational machinery component [Agrocybe pediades]